jgi:isocitrate dehydrogenase
MFGYLGWNEAAETIYTSLEKTIMEKKVTYDFYRQMDDAMLMSTSGFSDAIIRNM